MIIGKNEREVIEFLLAHEQAAPLWMIEHELAPYKSRGGLGSSGYMDRASIRKTLKHMEDKMLIGIANRGRTDCIVYLKDVCPVCLQPLKMPADGPLDQRIWCINPRCERYHRNVNHA